MNLLIALFCWLVGAAFIALAGYWCMALIYSREVLFLFAAVVCVGIAIASTTTASMTFFKGM